MTGVIHTELRRHTLSLKAAFALEALGAAAAILSVSNASLRLSRSVTSFVPHSHGLRKPFTTKLHDRLTCPFSLTIQMVQAVCWPSLLARFLEALQAVHPQGRMTNI